MAELLIRPFARYACHGDGLCCTDAHAIGPLTRADARRVRANDPRAVERHPALEILVTRTERGGCTFHGEGGCSIHHETGEREKPWACRRFPFDAVATPEGVRVTTEHRCPCRTLGERPELDVGTARASLADRAGRITPRTRIVTVPLAKRRRVAFEAWRAIEAPLLEALARGTTPEDALGVAPFGPLRDAAWLDVGHHLRGYVDGTKGGEALAWAGDAILSLTGDHRPRGRARPWAASFDRAEARSLEGDPAAILADWVADVVWDVSWADVVTWEVLRGELATRVAVARACATSLGRSGARPDRAMAEAVMIVELTGACGVWDGVRGSLGR